MENTDGQELYKHSLESRRTVITNNTVKGVAEQQLASEHVGVAGARHGPSPAPIAVPCDGRVGEGWRQSHRAASAIACGASGGEPGHLFCPVQSMNA